MCVCVGRGGGRGGGGSGRAGSKKNFLFRIARDTFCFHKIKGIILFQKFQTIIRSNKQALKPNLAKIKKNSCF